MAWRRDAPRGEALCRCGERAVYGGSMATDLHSDPSRGVPEGAPARTVAHVNLGSADSRGPSSDPVHLLESALARLEQTVRSNDQICPFALTRIAIAFGPD